jgi:uncharacterized OB-fold protein
MAKNRVPAVEGWFDMNETEPHLIGSRCTGCGSYFFPRESYFCRNPQCAGSDFEDVPLSSRGKLWSFTDNRYKPPAPYMSPDPFEPYIVAAVELDAEKMVVLGQVAGGVKIQELSAGIEMELFLDTLFEDDDNEYVVWKWRPVA